MPIQDLNSVFEVLRQTSLGEQAWKNFEPLIEKNQVTFLPYPVSITRQLKQVNEPGVPVGASLVIEGDKGVIYYDGTTCLGALLPVLFHEMIHSLDPSLWQAARDGFCSTEMRRKTLFEAECKAYSAQFYFLTEMKTRFPSYAEFLNNRFPNVSHFHRFISPEEITKLYRF